MSIMIGSSTKFKNVQGQVSPSPLIKSTKVYPPLDFLKLRTSNRFDQIISPQEQIPIDGSDAQSRFLSPFILQLEPPFIYRNLSLSKSNVSIDIYNHANKNPFVEARANINNFVLNDAPTIVREEVTVSQGGIDKIPSSRPSRNYPLLADLNTAMDQVIQLDSIINTPPLVLLINPQSFNRSFVKVQSYQDRTREGYVFHSWGEEQPKIEFSVKCGAFISGQRGVQNVSKKDSPAWQNLMSLMRVYKNNGYVYDSFGGSMANLAVGCVSIHYDQWIYYGHMESLNYSLDEQTTQLGGVTFEIAFKVSLMVDCSTNNVTVEPLKNPLNPYDFERPSARASDLPGDISVSLYSKKPRVEGPQAIPNNPANNLLENGPERPPTGLVGFAQATRTPSPSLGQQANPRPFRRVF